ncbi:Retrograde regulation 2 [Hyphodiscus hymeniophilus]|uniref:Retrograde regulation 2 n=1 Tax=Hyphodiscus hymeniophilus TaxID=353542 RepID=A0A9P6VDU6_9HELO|nr:Retrograde regulation 2 [Hyphodiscus hymeniophilus]
MFSNGIRFSVSDLSPPTTRILPTIYFNRVDISLYDVQFDDETGARIPIPVSITASVVAALLRFQIICEDFGVPKHRIRVIATEATRTAINADDFLAAIKSGTGLSVELLFKEEEGRIGALGIASGFSEMQGFAMDLGGGSTQFTWLISKNGNIRLSPKGSFSFPYGAAALTRKLAELKHGKNEHDADQAVAEFRKEMLANIVNAYHSMQVPQEIIEKAKKEGGFPLYLSGGGFRGWGYLLLYINQVGGRHYPISIINGFSAQRSQFEDTDALKHVARNAREIFRVSDRRRLQVPAVAFLVNVLAEALPFGIKEAHFCQGGVREGILFQELLPSIRKQQPLEVGTLRFAPPSVETIHALLLAGIPAPSKTDGRAFPQSISSELLSSFVRTLYVHSSMSKESASTAALYSTSAGLMSSTHGVSHTDRALLALMLEERYQGELPPREVEFKHSLRSILTAEQVWWTRYIGKLGLLISEIYPAGIVNEAEPRVVLSAAWSSHLGKKKNKLGLELIWSIQKVKKDPMKLREALENHISVIHKVGKRKNWIGGKDGWGMAVHVMVVEEDIV